MYLKEEGLIVEDISEKLLSDFFKMKCELSYKWHRINPCITGYVSLSCRRIVVSLLKKLPQWVTNLALLFYMDFQD